MSAENLPVEEIVIDLPYPAQHHTKVILGEIGAERARQMGVEGWSIVHDDMHEYEELAMAAGWYAIPPETRGRLEASGGTFWPFANHWLRTGDRRRDLVKAAALIVAELERLDRAAVAGIQRVDRRAERHG